jgi:hypothetical protein
MADVPADAYFSWGLHDGVILVIPSLDIVAVRAGTSGWQPVFTSDYSIVEPFFEPIATSVTGPTQAVGELASESWARMHAGFRD